MFQFLSDYLFWAVLWAVMIICPMIAFLVFNRKNKRAYQQGRETGYQQGYSRAEKGETRRLDGRIAFALRQFKIREKLLTIAEVAGLLGIKVKKLYHMRCDGKGPETTLLGGKPFYRQVDVDRWRRAQGDADNPGNPDEAPPAVMAARGGASAQ